jgi:Cu2+-exporting ATPase
MADSLVADLARLLEVGRQRRNAYVRAADKAARLYVPLVSGMAVMVLAGWLLAGADVAVAVTNAIAVLIITCPCALGLAVPAVQIAATGRLFAQGLLVKSGDALERLADIDTVIFDKTGTLTRGVLRLENCDGIAPEILEQAARLARASSHPLSRALSAAAGDGPVADGVREQSGAGLEAAIDGVTYRLGSASWCGAQVTGDGGELWYRAGPDAPVRFVFRDSLRSDAAKTVVGLRMRGITVEMLTGDGGAVAAQTAGEADIRVWHSGVGPQQKAARLESLRADGRRVLMVGDGLNDAAAMALAHVSIAPGTAADISQMTADMVLQGEKLALVVEAIDVARKARRLVRQNFLLAALYNVLAIPLAAAGLVTPLIAAGAMASSSILVSLNALRLVGGRAR